nr:hypothetical protein [Ktedonobacteraceae bacterium]
MPGLITSPGEAGKGSPLLYDNARCIRSAYMVGATLAVALEATIASSLFILITILAVALGANSCSFRTRTGLCNRR